MSSLATDFERMALLGAGAFALYAYMNHEQSGDGLHKKADSCGHGGPCYPSKTKGGSSGREHNHPDSVQTHGDNILSIVKKAIGEQVAICEGKHGIVTALTGCTIPGNPIAEVTQGAAALDDLSKRANKDMEEDLEGNGIKPADISMKKETGYSLDDRNQQWDHQIEINSERRSKSVNPIIQLLGSPASTAVQQTTMHVVNQLGETSTDVATTVALGGQEIGQKIVRDVHLPDQFGLETFEQISHIWPAIGNKFWDMGQPGGWVYNLGQGWDKF